MDTDVGIVGATRAGMGDRGTLAVKRSRPPCTFDLGMSRPGASAFPLQWKRPTGSLRTLANCSARLVGILGHK